MPLICACLYACIQTNHKHTCPNQLHEHAVVTILCNWFAQICLRYIYMRAYARQSAQDMYACEDYAHVFRWLQQISHKFHCLFKVKWTIITWQNAILAVSFLYAYSWDPNLESAWEVHLYSKVNMMLLSHSERGTFWSEQCTRCTCLGCQKHQKLGQRACFWPPWVEMSISLLK